jgi:hypothetical protein
LEESGDGFSTVFLKANEGLGPALWELYYNPKLLAVAKRIPLWFMAKVNPDLKAVHDVHVVGYSKEYFVIRTDSEIVCCQLPETV